METAKVKCQIHGDEIFVEDALVPSLSAITSEAKKIVTPAMLLDRAVCKDARKAAVLRGIPLYSYLDTLARIEKRGNERRAARHFASRFRRVRPNLGNSSGLAVSKPFDVAQGKPTAVTTCFVEGELAKLAQTKPVVVRR